MPRFYLHFSDQDGVTTDPDGADLRDLDEARRAAQRAARDMLASDIRAGELDLHQSIILADAEGRTLEQVLFSTCVSFKKRGDVIPEPRADRMALEGAAALLRDAEEVPPMQA